MNMLYDLCKNNSNSKKIFYCSIKYSAIIALLTGIRYLLWFENFLLIGSEILIPLPLFVLIELLIINVTSSFSYMILNNKMKFKRFFSFLHFKYFKFNCITLITYALFFGGCTFVVHYFRFYTYPFISRDIVYILAVILLALNSFKLIFSYFRAKYPNAKIKDITGMYFEFLLHNKMNIFIFNMKFIPYIALYFFLIIIFNMTDFEMIVYVMLNSCLYGVGIFLFPCYFYGLDKLVRSVKE